MTGLSRKRFEDSKAGDVTFLMDVYEHINVIEIIEYRIASSKQSSWFSTFEPIMKLLLHTILYVNMIDKMHCQIYIALNLTGRPIERRGFVILAKLNNSKFNHILSWPTPCLISFYCFNILQSIYGGDKKIGRGEGGSGAGLINWSFKI